MHPLVNARGRPRSAAAHEAILAAALRQVATVGFRRLTIDSIAAVAGVGKMTVYRRWPNKAALVMDAFLAIIGPGTGFPEGSTALASVKLQLRLQAKFFRSRHGKLIKALLGEAQFDGELADAFRDRWITPRRRMTRVVLERAVREGDVRGDIDLEIAIDMLYGPIYYRMQIGTGAITEAFTDRLFETVVAGLGYPGRTTETRNTA